MITSTPSVAVTDQHVAELIDFALGALPAMRLDDGAFCFERRIGREAPIGRSDRRTPATTRPRAKGRARDRHPRAPARRRQHQTFEGEPRLARPEEPCPRTDAK